MSDQIELRTGQREIIRATARRHSIDEAEFMARVRSRLFSMPGRRYGPNQHAVNTQLELAMAVVLAEMTPAA